MSADAGTVQTQAYAQLNAQLSAAKAFVLDLNALINLIEPDIFPLPIAQYDANSTLYNLLQIQPPFITAQLVNVPLPTSPTLSFDPIGDVTVPDFTVSPPGVDIPDAPVFVAPPLPVQPSINDIALPTAPSVTLPTVPSLSAINIPLAPSIIIPDFTSTLPPDDLVTPTNVFSFSEQPYQDILLDAEKTKLMNDLINGSYGIEPLDEINLWNRARDREVDVTLMEIDEAYRAPASRGFPLPPGDIAIVVERALQKQQEKLSSVSRDIAIKRGELYAETRKFTITEVRELETTLMNYWNSVQERGLNAAKATLDAVIAIYETVLKRYNARLEAYRTDAMVFEAKIRAASVQVEIYRSQIQAAQVTAEVQRIQVEIYNAQLRGVETTIEIFKTQMEAANIASEIQRTKIEAFRSLIDAYTAQIQGQVATQNAYEARIKGELAKVQVFEAQASAYNSQVEGLKVRSDIIIGKARAQWEQASVKIENFKGQLQGAELDLKGQLGIVSSNIEIFKARTQQFAASTDALAKQFSLDEESIKNAREINLKNADLNLETSRLRLERGIESLKVQAQGLQIGGTYYANLIAALSGSIQAIATVSG